MGIIKKFIDFYNGESKGYGRSSTVSEINYGIKEPQAYTGTLKHGDDTGLRRGTAETGFWEKRDNAHESREENRSSWNGDGKSSWSGGDAARARTNDRYGYESISGINMYYPKRFDDIARLIDSIRQKEAVIVDLCYLPDGVLQKMLDFMSGAIYALNGGMQRINGTTFLFTPTYVKVSVTQS